MAVLVTPVKSARATDIPLYLVPRAITRMIRERGEKVYRISVVRARFHHYNISVRTRWIPREIQPARPRRAPELFRDEEGAS